MSVYKSVSPGGSMVSRATSLSTYQLIQRVIEFAQTIILARLLTPADFGVVAAALIFIQLTQLVVEIGVGATIVQASHLDERDVRVAGTLVGLNALFYFGVTQLLAGPAGTFMHSQGVEAVIRVLAFNFLLQTVSVVAEGLMLRELEAARIARIQTIIKVGISVGLGIILAALGWGYWSLVIPSVISPLVRSICTYNIVRQPLVPLFDKAVAKKLLRKGLGFSTSRVINFAAIRGDNTLVGHLFSVATLGIYSRAYNLMNLPAELYGTIADRLIFPSLAKAQDNKTRLGHLYLRYVELTALVGLPLSAGLFVLGREWILVVLGDKWIAVVAPFQVLVFVTYFRLGMKVSASLQRATGAVRSMILTQAIYATLVIGGCLISYRFGLVALSGAVSAGVFIAYLAITISAMRITKTGTRRYLACHVPGLKLGFGTLLLASAAMYAGQTYDLSPFAVLSVFGALFGLASLFLILTKPKSMLGDVGEEIASRLHGTVLAKARKVTGYRRTR